MQCSKAICLSQLRVGNGSAINMYPPWPASNRGRFCNKFVRFGAGLRFHVLTRVELGVNSSFGWLRQRGLVYSTLICSGRLHE